MAKSDIGTITIRLRAEAQQFDASMKKGAQSVGNFQAKVKASTEKMSVAWTSLQSKIGLVTGGIEGALKLGSAALRIFKGDADGAVDALKTLPFGIGPVVSAMEGFYSDISGYTDLLEKQTAAVAKLKKETKALADQVKRNRDAMSEAGAFRADKDNRLNVLGASQRGQSLDFEMDAEIQANNRRWNKESAALAKQMTPQRRSKTDPSWGFDKPELNSPIATALVAKGLAELDKQNALVREYYDELKKIKALQEWQARYQKDVSAYMQASATAQSDINKTARHEIQLLTKQGASEEDILKRKLKLHEDIGQELKKQNTGLRAGGADDAVLAASRLAMQEHKIKGVQSLEMSIAEQMKAKDDIGLQGQKGVTSSFSTAVGSIVIPDARASQSARQAQLTELQKINANIIDLNAQLVLARNQNP